MRLLARLLLVLLVVDWQHAAGAAETATAAGRNIYVDASQGDDRATGLAAKANAASGPVRSLRAAIKAARPGDTIHLTPQAEPYRDIAVFHNVQGEPQRPITLDGHEATITGAEPLVAADWQEVSSGLYRNDHLLAERLLTANDAAVSRWFFVFDGRVNHMGRTRKGQNQPLKAPADLQPGEWTYQADGHAFYIKIDPARKLADYRIEAPVRVDGVQISGDCAHLMIRNLITTHAYNDGFGLHGRTRDVRFENIQAIECGDDGFSADDDCQIAIDGFVSLGNTSGLANTGDSRSTNNRIYLDGNLGTDLLFLGSGVHTIRNSVLRLAGTYSLQMWGGDGFENFCTLKLENVLIERAGDTSMLKIYHNGALEAEHCTFFGLGFQADGRSLTLHDCVVAGKPSPELWLSPASLWKAQRNVYDLAALRVGNKIYNAAQFAEYQRTSGQDANSRWIRPQPSSSSPPAPSSFGGAGVDRSQLPPPPAR